MHGGGGSQAAKRAENVSGLAYLPRRLCTADVLILFHRLDKHGLGSEPLPDEAGVPSLLEALDVDDREKSGWPHALSTIEVSATSTPVRDTNACRLSCIHADASCTVLTRFFLAGSFTSTWRRLPYKAGYEHAQQRARAESRSPWRLLAPSRTSPESK